MYAVFSTIQAVPSVAFAHLEKDQKGKKAYEDEQDSHALVVETNRAIEVEATTSTVCKLLKVRWPFTLIYMGKVVKEQKYVIEIEIYRHDSADKDSRPEV
jgi:hypothetical protein